jgi:hypothetical protein
MVSSEQSSQNAILNVPSVFTYLSMISPFLIVLLFVFISIINSNLKGFIYLLGIFMLFFLVLIFQNVVKGEAPNDASPYCNVFYFIVSYRIESYRIESHRIESDIPKKRNTESNYRTYII